MSCFVEKIAALQKTNEEVSVETVKEILVGKLMEIGDDYFTLEDNGNEKFVNIKNVISIQKKIKREKHGLGVFKEYTK